MIVHPLKTNFNPILKFFNLFHINFFYSLIIWILIFPQKLVPFSIVFRYFFYNTICLFVYPIVYLLAVKIIIQVSQVKN